MNTNNHWNQVALRADDRSSGRKLLRGLVDSEVAVVVCKDLLGEKLLQSGLKQIRDHYGKKFATQYVNGTLTTIGPYLAKHLSRPEEYFENACVTDEVFTEPDFDLRRLVRNRLQTLFGLQSLRIEEEPDGRRYADSVVRIHADGVCNPLHNDNIMRDAASTGLSLARLKHQLSCIVCIQECDQGGELISYRKTWNEEDEAFKIKGGLGYDRGVVGDVPRTVFRPQTGDVYVINPTNYHEIERVGGKDRITLGFFIGFYDDDLRNAVVWS
ncbi:2OG-Fe(II)-dependent halogenase WelO5 family protein [Sorangium sp. So ce1389]|uniref:2OG-Fe(II)-dependent halogenase WelO5 family protein n=1 Tax=Sorangium sp. So ce1389 TaxID=3133336 RepID=UPI003F641854